MILIIMVCLFPICGLSNQDFLSLSEQIGINLIPDKALLPFLNSNNTNVNFDEFDKQAEILPLQQFISKCYKNDVAVYREVNSKNYLAVPRDSSFKQAWETSCDELQKIFKTSNNNAGSETIKLKSGFCNLLPVNDNYLKKCWHVAKFDGLPSSNQFEIGEYVGQDTWLVKPIINSHPKNIVSAAEFTSKNKIDPKLYSYNSYQIGDSPNLRTINIYVLDSKKTPEVKSLIIRLNGEITSEIASIGCVIAVIPTKYISKLAEHNNIKWIAKAGPPLSAHNDGAVATVGANSAQQNPYDYYGTNVSVLVYDSGITKNHIDFSKRTSSIGDDSSRDHSTHVAGIILGDGSASDGLYRGMAPEAQLISSGYGKNENILFYNNPSDIEADYYSAINSYGADVANNSIGMNIQMNCYPDSYYGDYETCCILIDNIATGILGRAFLSIWAAGNERLYSIPDYHNISPPQCAKNSLVVGSTYSDNNAVTYSSSFGPLDDGRLKPDLCAPGDQSGAGNGICSTVGTNEYKNMSGTSMAAPVVTGCAALLTECWRNYNSGRNPAPAVVKAILINTTLDLGDPGPGYDTGYGLIQIIPALEAVKNNYIFESEIADKTSLKFSLFVPDTDNYVRVTLAWSDPPASPLAESVLVNNIGVKLIDPLGEVHYPWTLDPKNPENPATNNVPDSLNNVEQVLAKNIPGVWEIVVAGHVPVGNNQSFALCANGVIQDVSSAGVIKLNRRGFTIPSDVIVEVKDLDLINNNKISILAFSDTNPEGYVFSLTQSVAGVFTSCIPLTTNSPADNGFLSVSHKDTLSVVYFDDNNGAGGVNIKKTATASIDVMSPGIFNVDIVNASDSAAIIKWETDESSLSSLILISSEGNYSETFCTPSHKTIHQLIINNLLPGTEYKFIIVATDHYGLISTNNNSGDYFSFKTKFYENSFNDNAENECEVWENTSGWHRSQLRPLSGNFSWYCGNETTKEYPNRHDAFLETKSITIDSPCAALRFKEYIETEAGYDYCYVKISTDNGNTWIDLRPKVSGSYSTRNVSLCLADYVPGTFKIRFFFDSDSLIPREGWYIDDIQIGGFTYSNLVVDSVVTIDPMPTGNNDGFTDPGETVNMQVILLNDTDTFLPNINSVLSTDSPYVKIIQNSSPYENMNTKSYTTNSSLFKFSIDPDTPNYSCLPFTLTCANSSGEVWSNKFNVFVEINNIPECSLLFSFLATIMFVYRITRH